MSEPVDDIDFTERPLTRVRLVPATPDYTDYLASDVCCADSDDCIRGADHDGECRYPTWMTP